MSRGIAKMQKFTFNWQNIILVGVWINIDLHLLSQYYWKVNQIENTWENLIVIISLIVNTTDKRKINEMSLFYLEEDFIQRESLWESWEC